MTIQIIKNSATSSISIDELVDFLRSEIDFKDTDSIQSAHHNFGRLFLNKDLIKNHILHEIKRGTTDFESINKYTPPSLILYACQDFFIRANLWRATEQYLDNDINLYGLAHDHNFDFLTLNYKGPGYTSKMYTYDYSNINGYINEPVKLYDNGFLNLSEGEMYFYRKNLDVHSQFPPREDSITINLMVSLPQYNHTNQFIFDTTNRVIQKIYGGFFSQKHIYDMALLLNDHECNALMLEIASKNENKKSSIYINSRISK